MDTGYITLFTELARSSEVIAEQVMALNKANNDEQGETTAAIMRDDYAKLYDKLRNGDGELSRNEFAKLLVSTYIVVNNLEDRIKNYTKSVEQYKINVMPKLQRIIDETKTDEEAKNLANEIFTINT